MSNKNILLKTLTALALSSMLFACGSQNNTDSSASDSSSSLIASEGLKSDVIALSNSQNLTISIAIATSSGALGLSYNNYYTPNYVYSEDFNNGDWGYIESSEGVYPVNQEDDGSLLPGELLYSDSGLLLTGLWDQGLFPYFSSLNTDEFPETSGDYVLKNKLNILTMLDIYGFSRSRYLEVESITFHSGEYLTDFTAKLQLGSAIYQLSVVNTSPSNETIDSFISNGGTAFTPDEGLVKMRSLFEADNYNRDVIDYSSQESIGTEHFTPDYFYGDYDTTVAVPYGLMRFSNETITYSGYQFEMNGCYYFTVQSNQVVLSPSNPYNSSADIASVCFYLHDPLLFSSFQHVEFDSSNNTYSTTDQEILIDFAENNQVYDQIVEIGASLYRLDFKLYDIFEDTAEVEFNLYYGLSESDLNVATYRFLDFGSANVTLLDTFLTTVRA